VYIYIYVCVCVEAENDSCGCLRLWVVLQEAIEADLRLYRGFLSDPECADWGLMDAVNETAGRNKI
jgi:hypothetical protein